MQLLSMHIANLKNYDVSPSSHLYDVNSSLPLCVRVREWWRLNIYNPYIRLARSFCVEFALFTALILVSSDVKCQQGKQLISKKINQNFDKIYYKENRSTFQVYYSQAFIRSNILCFKNNFENISTFIKKKLKMYYLLSEVYVDSLIVSKLSITVKPVLGKHRKHYLSDRW